VTSVAWTGRWTGCFRVCSHPSSAAGPCCHDRQRTVLHHGDDSGVPVAVGFRSLMAQLRILLDPELRLGECYVDGTFVIEQGSILDVLALAFSQPGNGSPECGASLRS